jgi:hypothetical protein
MGACYSTARVHHKPPIAPSHVFRTCPPGTPQKFTVEDMYGTRDTYLFVYITWDSFFCLASILAVLFCSIINANY